MPSTVVTSTRDADTKTGIEGPELLRSPRKDLTRVPVFRRTKDSRSGRVTPGEEGVRYFLPHTLTYLGPPEGLGRDFILLRYREWTGKTAQSPK